MSCKDLNSTRIWVNKINIKRICILCFIFRSVCDKKVLMKYQQETEWVRYIHNLNNAQLNILSNYFISWMHMIVIEKPPL